MVPLATGLHYTGHLPHPGCRRLLLCSTQPQTPSTLHLESESEEILLSGVAEIQRFKLALRVASVYVWRFLFYKNWVDPWPPRSRVFHNNHPGHKRHPGFSLFCIFYCLSKNSDWLFMESMFSSLAVSKNVYVNVLDLS